jgi:hypothetical protein
MSLWVLRANETRTTMRREKNLMRTGNDAHVNIDISFWREKKKLENRTIIYRSRATFFRCALQCHLGTTLRRGFTGRMPFLLPYVLVRNYKITRTKTRTEQNRSIIVQLK